MPPKRPPDARQKLLAFAPSAADGGAPAPRQPWRLPVTPAPVAREDRGPISVDYDKWKKKKFRELLPEGTTVDRNGEKYTLLVYVK